MKGVGLRNGGCDWDASRARSRRGRVVEAWGRARDATGDGGESMESQEGEFGAEVSAFLFGAACVWALCMCGLPCARARL